MYTIFKMEKKEKKTSGTNKTSVTVKSNVQQSNPKTIGGCQNSDCVDCKGGMGSGIMQVYRMHLFKNEE